VNEGESFQKPIEFFLTTVERSSIVRRPEFSTGESSSIPSSLNRRAFFSQKGFQARFGFGRGIQRCQEGGPLRLIEKEQAAVGQGFSRSGQAAIEQEFTDGFVSNGRRFLQHPFGRGCGPNINPLRFSFCVDSHSY
jgi:hypothetical protein